MTGSGEHDDEAPRPGWRTLCHYAYVARAYDDVWPMLAAAPQRVLGDEEAGPAGAGLSDLHVRRGGVDLTRKVRLSFGGLVADEDLARMALRWEDAAHPALFPVLEGILSLAPLTAGRRRITQVGLAGRYRPPLGALGGAGDRLLGREVAVDSVAGFVDALARRLEAMAPPELLGPESPAEADPAEPGDADRSRVLVMLDGLDERPGGAAAVDRQLAGTAGVVRAEVDPLAGMAEIVFDPERCSLNRLLSDLDAAGPVGAEPASRE